MLIDALDGLDCDVVHGLKFLEMTPFVIYSDSRTRLSIYYFFV